MASVVALDFSRAGIRAVQIDEAYTPRPRISRFGNVAVPEGTIFDGEIVDTGRGVKAIKELWKKSGFTTNRVAFGIGNRKVVVREATLPVLPKAQRKQSLRFAVEGQIPLDLDDAILDFLPLRDVGGGQQEGLLVATVKSGLETTVTAIEDAGKQVDAVDFAGFSLLRVSPGAPGETRPSSTSARRAPSS
ncbi:type IV pilus biogenesis protein PilM [Microbacterium sp.]|uniref:type IV pilus biogenesis protein PilM n=1 Tax=Microbacterium sp. TaxID=51671 RepID=UPI0039E24096